ncbi:hypothetical protein BSKO_03504 [Bryopsis sp. KO-2023]|nr:hypothetical protein BSKO_03504 [Bryopsis sp. KO-2023]
MATSDARKRAVQEIEADLQEVKYPSKLIHGAQRAFDLSMQGVHDLTGSAVAPLLVHVVMNSTEPDVLVKCLAAMTGMAAWAEGRCDLRLSGCLRILQEYLSSSNPELRQHCYELLRNLSIEKSTRDFVKSTPIFRVLTEYVLLDAPEGNLTGLVLSALTNVTLTDEEALKSLCNTKGLTPKLLDIAKEGRLGESSKAALLLSHMWNCSEEVGQDLLEAGENLRIQRTQSNDAQQRPSLSK